VSVHENSDAMWSISCGIAPQPSTLGRPDLRAMPAATPDASLKNQPCIACRKGPHRAVGHQTDLSSGTGDFTPPTTTEPSRHSSRWVRRSATVPHVATLALDENHGQAI
jgi:hypothetical protein